ncbi:MAG TPA: hypothetical protein VJL29_00160 [Thermoguttaceae bacterium]|nr:hypothetical protein [Thermoguttaceae bacterium]
MRRVKKILKWTFIVVGGLVAILLIVNAYFVWTTGARLERELAKIRAAGDPTSLADLQPDPIPPEQNAATYLRRAKDDLKAIDHEIYTAAKAAGNDWDCPAVHKATLAAIAAYPKVLPLLEKAADCPGYASEEPLTLDGVSDSDEAIKVLLVRVQDNREVARLLGSYWPNALLAEGKRDEAARAAITVLKLTRHFDREPAVVSFLVSVACRGVACYTLNNAMQSGPVSPDVRKELEDELAKHDMIHVFHESLITERAFGLDWFRAFPLGRWWFTRAYCNRLKIQYLAQLDWFLAETSGDPTTARTLTSPPRYDKTLGTMILPSLEAARNMVNNMASKINAIRVLNALQRRADPEKLPAADLSDLGLPKEATLDLFTGKPLIVKKVPGGWLIYSVGMNLKDDGGKVYDDDYQDTGFAPPKPRPREK